MKVSLEIAMRAIINSMIHDKRQAVSAHQSNCPKSVAIGADVTIYDKEVAFKFTLPPLVVNLKCGTSRLG